MSYQIFKPYLPLAFLLPCQMLFTWFQSQTFSETHVVTGWMWDGSVKNGRAIMASDGAASSQTRLHSFIKSNFSSVSESKQKSPKFILPACKSSFKRYPKRRKCKYAMICPIVLFILTLELFPNNDSWSCLTGYVFHLYSDELWFERKANAALTALRDKMHPKCFDVNRDNRSLYWSNVPLKATALSWHMAS